MKDGSYIIVAEDEVGQAEILRYNLEEAGFEVATAHDGKKAKEMIEDKTPDLLILDWMMPEMSGIKIMRWLRAQDETKNLPVIMLTARGEEDDKIHSFELGVDDYIVKPYLPSELIARVKAVLRRSSPEVNNILSVADLIMNIEQKKVTRGGEFIKLGPTEFRLLRVFMAKPGKVFSREQLLNKAWGQDVYVEDRTVDVAVKRLRTALNSDNKPDLFRTVRGDGYALEAENTHE